jgi:hypothetical protein
MRRPLPVSAEISCTFKLDSQSNGRLGKRRLQLATNQSRQRIRIEVIQAIASCRARLLGREQGIVEAHLRIDGMGRRDPMDGAANLATIRRITPPRLRILGTA